MYSFIVAFFIWAALHSITAAHWFKNWSEQLLGPPRHQAFYRLGYTLFSVLTFLPLLVIYWQLPDVVLYAVPAPWAWLMILGQLVGVAGLTISVLQTQALSFVGVQQALDYLSGRQDLAKAGLGEELVVSGMYRYMRHPLYTFSMLALWLTPLMTRNTLVFVTLSTVYFLIGSIFEERRLVADFGDDYVKYRRAVPRFIPRLTAKN